MQFRYFANTLFSLILIAGIAWPCLLGCRQPEEVVVLPPADDAVTEKEITPKPEFSPALTAFLEKFDRLESRGFLKTLRSGSTGVGYTLETLLEIQENNSPKGDFMGMELKAFRDEDIAATGEKMNLFLKEPKWCDGLSAAERLKKYGYTDDNGRVALYSTVKVQENSHGFRFEVQPDDASVWLCFRGQRVGSWSRETLGGRLLEKLSETVFVSAHATGRGKNEQFHYYGVLWCQQPSVEKFISLLRRGEVMLELRMHLKDNGSARNHGSAFRIKQNRIKDLFEVVQQVRPEVE